MTWSDGLPQLIQAGPACCCRPAQYKEEPLTGFRSRDDRSMSYSRGFADFGSPDQDATSLKGTANTWDSHCGSLFLRRLPAPDLRRLEPYLEMKVFAREEVIQHEGDLIRDIIFPHGIVFSLVCRMADETQVESATVGSEGYVGVESMLGSAVAISTVVARQGKASTIALDRMLILMDQAPSLRAAMFTYARNYLAVVSRLAACNAIHSLKQRACRRLLLAFDLAEQRPIAITQEELARALGVGRSSVNQACKELRRSRFIDYSRGHIQIKDIQGMVEASCECYQYLKYTLLI